MENCDYKIKSNFEARQIYNKAVFYCKGNYNKNTESISAFADKVNHLWDEHTIRIKENKMRLKLHTPRDENNQKKFGAETLDIEFFGNDKEKESAKKDLEGLTGITIQ